MQDAVLAFRRHDHAGCIQECDKLLAVSPGSKILKLLRLKAVIANGDKSVPVAIDAALVQTDVQYARASFNYYFHLKRDFERALEIAKQNDAGYPHSLLILPKYRKGRIGGGPRE